MAHEAFEGANIDNYSTDPADITALAEAYDKLARYARYKAGAMRARLHGNIPAALSGERECERIYDTLPYWARW